MFSTPVGDRLESTAASEEAAFDLVQARANGPENEPRASSSPITASKVFDESSHPGDIEDVTPRVPKRERRPVATTMKPAAEQSPKLEKIVDGANESPRRNDPGRGETATPAARDESVLTSPGDIREPHRLASAARLQNKPGERGPSEQLSEPRVANNSTTVAPADHIDQRGRSGTLVVPRIVIEKISADKYQRRPISLPVSKVPQGGNGFRSSTNALDSATGSAARPLVELDKEPAQTETIEPIINVTIGRVEVRAAAPATSQLKDRNSTASSKLMSLDDYLRQRAQGGKR